jgi:hypothetical protein
MILSDFKCRPKTFSIKDQSTIDSLFLPAEANWVAMLLGPFPQKDRDSCGFVRVLFVFWSCVVDILCRSA